MKNEELKKELHLEKESWDVLVELLAAIEHERWASWQNFMHSLCLDRVIPEELFNRWERKISTPYSELSEKEKQSDRDQVMRYLPLIQSFLNQPKEEQKWNELCTGCPEGHNSFWKTITESSQWKEWSKVAQHRGWDISETEECGWISPEHWLAFCEYIIKR